MSDLLLVALIQASYDYVGWCWIIQKLIHNEYGVHAKIFRVIKFILDFPVTIYLMLTYMNITWVDVWFFSMPVEVCCFYIMKWWHLCDSMYNIIDYILTNKPTSDWANWRWWTPLGLIRMFYQYRETWKTIVYLKEAWIQTAIGIVIAEIILIIWT